MFPPSADNGKPYSHGTQGHSHKAPLKQLYVSSGISSIMCRKRGPRRRFVSDTARSEGGGGAPRTRSGGERRVVVVVVGGNQRNTGGQGSATRGRGPPEPRRENERRKIEMEWESEVSIKKMNPSAFGR